MKNRARYAAFLSYSWQARPELSTLLHTRLQRTARPWWKIRARRTFLDRSTIPAFTRTMLRLRSRPDPSIEKILFGALSSAERFILMASRESAKSKWVNFEVETWLKIRDVCDLFIVLIDGQIESCSDRAEIDWSKTNSLPICLRGVLNSIPLYVDLREDFRDSLENTNNSTLHKAVVNLTAAIEGISRDEVEARIIRQRWRRSQKVWQRE